LERKLNMNPETNLYQTSNLPGNRFPGQQMDKETPLLRARKHADSGDPAEGLVELFLEFHKAKNSYDREKFVQISIEIIGYIVLDYPDIKGETIDDFNGKMDEYLGKDIGEKLRKVAIAGLNGVGQIASEQPLKTRRNAYDSLTGRITYKTLQQ
jgi:hypothetical protein